MVEYPTLANLAEDFENDLYSDAEIAAAFRTVSRLFRAYADSEQTPTPLSYDFTNPEHILVGQIIAACDGENVTDYLIDQIALLGTKYRTRARQR